MIIKNVKSVSVDRKSNMTVITLTNGNEVVLPSGDHQVKIVTADFHGSWDISHVEIAVHSI